MDGEFSIHLIGIEAPLDISDDLKGDADEIGLIRSWVWDNLSQLDLPEDGVSTYTLKMTATQVNGHWGQYYEREKST